MAIVVETMPSKAILGVIRMIWHSNLKYILEKLEFNGAHQAKSEPPRRAFNTISVVLLSLIKKNRKICRIQKCLQKKCDTVHQHFSKKIKRFLNKPKHAKIILNKRAFFFLFQFDFICE